MGDIVEPPTENAVRPARLWRRLGWGIGLTISAGLGVACAAYLLKALAR